MALAALAGRGATPGGARGAPAATPKPRFWLFSLTLHLGARRRAAGPPQVASSILARMGYARVTQARDGQEALDHIAARGGPDAFDFILMDLHMPRKARAARGRDSPGRRLRCHRGPWLSALHRARHTIFRFCLRQCALHTYKCTTAASGPLCAKRAGGVHALATTAARNGHGKDHGPGAHRSRSADPLPASAVASLRMTRARVAVRVMVVSSWRRAAWRWSRSCARAGRPAPCASWPSPQTRSRTRATRRAPPRPRSR